MKTIINFFERIFCKKDVEDIDSIPVRKGPGFMDYSSREKIRILRVAGREAQREQTELLKEYDSRFGRTQLSS